LARQRTLFRRSKKFNVGVAVVGVAVVVAAVAGAIAGVRAVVGVVGAGGNRLRLKQVVDGPAAARGRPVCIDAS